MITGDAAVGKTALLWQAAGADVTRVAHTLLVEGVDTERDFAYTALQRLQG